MAIHPLPKFHFQVQWGGARIGFTEVTGLDLQVDPIEYRKGSSLEYHKIKMPRTHKFSNISLKRGTIPNDSDFYKWINAINLDTAERRDIIISVLDESNTPVVTWKVKNAFPVKVQASDLKADGNEVAIETLEIAHEGLNILS